MKKSIFVSILLGCVLSLYGCSSGGNDRIELQGAGATFPYPLYSKMFDEYSKAYLVQVNYQSIGSGGGIRQLKNKTVDFGATDAFMKDKMLKTSQQKILHIPIALGAVAMAYHLPGVDALNLTSDLLAQIFLGEVKKWNDPKIQAVNPKVKLPDLGISVVYRSDGSGMTFVVTEYLSKTSAAWKKKVGQGKSVNWPVGIGGKGNAGVAGMVKQTPGAIGYLGHIYTEQNKMTVAKIQNQKGQFISPSLEAVTEAANTSIPDDTRASITNTDAKKGYPLSGFTWILVYKDQNFNGRSIEKARETKRLVKWMVTDGQRFAKPLLYAPISEPVKNKALKLIETITFDGQPLSIEREAPTES